MKTLKVYLVMAVAAMAITSCSNDEEVNSAENGGTPITLGTTIGYGQSATTRAAKNASYDYYHSTSDENLLQNTQFCGSAILGSTSQIFYSQVAVYVEESVDAGETATNYAKPAGYKPNGAGGLTPSTKQYYPNNDNDVKIYAYYPYGSFLNYGTEPTLPSWPISERSGSIDFTVQDDQSNAVGYCISDLMYANTTVAKANRTSAANLNFSHLLSKVVVKIKKASDTRAQLLNGAAVSITNVKKSIAFNVADGTVPSATASTETPSDIKIMQMNNPAGTFDFPESTSENLGYAIIVPQTVSAETEFIKIALDWSAIGTLSEDGGINDTVTEFVYKLPSDVTFEGGKVYTFTLTIDAEHPIVLSTSISDWTSAGTDPNGHIPN